MDWLLTAAPLLGLAIDCAGQIAFAHAARRSGASIVTGALCGLVTTCGIIAYAAVSAAPGFVGAPTWAILLMTYFALAFGYWVFLNLNLTSVRIRLIRELLKNSNGTSRAEILQRYSAEEFLQRRLERLRDGSRQFSYTNGRWRLRKRTLLYAARAIGALRALLIPKSSAR